MRIFKRFFDVVTRPSARFSLGTLVGGGLLAGFILIGGAGYALNYTNTMEFCISCHEMRDTVYQEYKESRHYMNQSGVRAECPDCHVPREFGPMLRAKVMAVKDVWFTITGKVDTVEKFEAHRWEMASRVWEQMRASDSATCRSCHSFDSMDLGEQDRMARKKHESAPEDGKTCIDCHRGIVHIEPDEPEA